MPIELWKDIEHTKYQISNIGRIRNKLTDKLSPVAILEFRAVRASVLTEVEGSCNILFNNAFNAASSYLPLSSSSRFKISFEAIKRISSFGLFK